MARQATIQVSQRQSERPVDRALFNLSNFFRLGPSADHTIGDDTGHYVYADASNGPTYDYAYLVRKARFTQKL